MKVDELVTVWCVGVVSHSYGGLGGRAGGGGLYSCGTKPGGGGGVSRMSGKAGALPECEVIH